MTVHPALSPRCPRCFKLCTQPELAFCGKIYIEFRAIQAQAYPSRIALLVCLTLSKKKIWRC